MYTVVMKRGPKSDLVRQDATQVRAEGRAMSLCDLHGLPMRAYQYDEAIRTYTLDASSYYGEK